MDQELLVNDFRKVAEKLDRERGPLVLFMLLTPEFALDEAVNVIVSAKGLDQLDLGTAIRELVDLLKETLRDESWSKILHVTVLKTDDKFVRALNWAHPSESPAVQHLYSANISGVDIPKAMILQSKAAA